MEARVMLQPWAAFIPRAAVIIKVYVKIRNYPKNLNSIYFIFHISSQPSTIFQEVTDPSSVCFTNTDTALVS